MPRQGQVEKVAGGLEAAQAWLTEVWQGFTETGREDLARRAYALIVQVDKLAGDATRFPAAGRSLLKYS